jgi:hypothetical protein
MVRLVAGAFLGSLALVACSSAPDPATSSSPTAAEAIGSAASDLAIPSKRPRRKGGFLPGVIPFRIGPQVTATPQCANPRLFYYGGPLLQNPVIIAVFWNSNVNATIQANIGQFYADVTLSSYWPWLQEYDSVGLNPGTQQAILPGSSGGDVVLVPQRCAASTTTSCALTDADIQVELVRQIGLGVLPAPTLDCTGNANTLYMVDFPPNVSLSGPSGAGKSCVTNGFCGYHSTGTYGANKAPLVYGALMDVFTGPCSKGCSNNATALENATNLHSHELVESVTDPDVGLDTESNYAYPAGWGDNNNECGEVADICDDGKPGDTITVSGRSWVVQELWSNEQGKCTSTGPAAQAVCSGATVTNCRLCSCGDNGDACDGATPVCDTTSTAPSCAASVDAGADAATDSGEDAGSDAKSDAATGIDAGMEAGAGAGNDGGVGSSGEGGNGASRDSGGDATSAFGDDAGGVGGTLPDAGPDAGPGGQDASSDASARPLDAGMSGLDSAVDAKGAAPSAEGGVLNDASSTDAGPRVTSGDDSGCGCRVARSPSSASPAFFGVGALAVLGCLRSRRRRRVSS